MFHHCVTHLTRDVTLCVGPRQPAQSQHAVGGDGAALSLYSLQLTGHQSQAQAAS